MRSQAKTVPDALFGIAEGQQGYFTAKQAADAGYQLGSQAHHAKSGNWVRVERGIYRLARFPQSAEEQLVIYEVMFSNDLNLIPKTVTSWYLCGIFTD